MAEQLDMNNRGPYPELSERLRQAAASRALTDSDLNRVTGGANGSRDPDGWKTRDHVRVCEPGCPRTRDFTYCMICGF